MSEKLQETTNAQGKRGATNVPTPKMRRGAKGFLTDTRAELKKVTWPTRTETNRLTGVVLAVCVLCVLFLYGLSMGFGWVLETIFGARG